MLQTLVTGLVVGSLYALVALGFTILYKSAQLINFAHGYFAMLAAYLSVTLIGVHGLPYAPALLVLAVLGVLLGIAIFHTVMRRIVNAGLFAAVMATVGMGFMIESGLAIAYGSQPRIFRPPLPTHRVEIGTISLTFAEILVVAAVAVTVLAFALFFRYTRPGLEMRAVAADPEAAAMQGVNVRRSFAVSWGAAIALAFVAGLFIATLNPFVDIGIAAIGLRAFPAAVIGGFDSIPGAIVGGLLVGVLESAGSFYIGADVNDALVFGALLVVIMIRPSGLFGSKELVRA